MNISVPVTQIETPEGQVVFGFTHQWMAIFDPTLSDCGRFEVNPLQEYGLDAQSVAGLAEINRMLSAMVDAAIRACRKQARSANALVAVDLAAEESFWADPEPRCAFEKGAADYLQTLLPSLGVAVAV